MKHLKILFLVFSLASFLASNAQEFPWEKYGFDPNIVTLSKGKYQEFHDLKVVVEIGSVLYNTQTKKIVGFVEKDTLYSEADLKPHIISRWISPDPLSDEYSSWSPYNYVMNNPIILIDPDGREPNRAQSGTVEQFFSQFSRNSNVSGIYQHVKENSTSVIRYVYTQNEGWIDMNHVFSVLENGKAATDLLEPASGNPIIRELAFKGNGETSFFSYEDLPSNRVGDEIGKAMIEVNGEQLSGEQLMEFITNELNDRGATSPTDAPNYSKIPASEDRKAAKTKLGFGRPLTESEQKSGEYVPQNYTDQPFNLNNFSAAPTSLEKEKK